MKTKTRFWKTVVFLASILPSLPAIANQQINVQQAWIPEAPPVSKVMAAYMLIKNNGDSVITITGASSPDFGAIEFHQTIHRDNKASMVREKELHIPAKKNLHLHPGSYHMMLFDPTRKLVAGDICIITLTLSDASKVNIEVKIKNRDKEVREHHHHNH